MRLLGINDGTVPPVVFAAGFDPVQALWSIVAPIGVLLAVWIFREVRNVLSSRQRLDRIEAQLPKLATGEVVDEQLAVQAARIEQLELERIANAREIGELRGRHANLDLVIDLARRVGALDRDDSADEEPS